MTLTDARDAIVQEITVRGSAERIFEALTDPDQRMKWWGAEGAVRLFLSGCRAEPRNAGLRAARSR